MNTWIIVLLAIGGIVVGWLINDARWKNRMYQQGWRISKLTKKKLESMSSQIAKHLDSITDTELEEFMQKYTSDQVPPIHSNVEISHSNKGYQEWVEEHQTDNEEQFAANYAEENKQQLYETAGAYWNKLTINQRINQLVKWGIPQAFLPIGIEWKNVPENIQIEWVTNYTEQDEYQTEDEQFHQGIESEEQFLDSVYGNGQKMQESCDPIWKRPPEVSTDHYLNIKGELS